MHFYLNATEGHIRIGDYGVTWANADSENGLDGFFAINFGAMSLEFGDVDQGKPGIYVVTYKDHDIDECKTLWQAK